MLYDLFFLLSTKTMPQMGVKTKQNTTPRTSSRTGSPNHSFGAGNNQPIVIFSKKNEPLGQKLRIYYICTIKSNISVFDFII